MTASLKGKYVVWMLNADGLVCEALLIPSSITPAIAANLQNNDPTAGSQNENNAFPTVIGGRTKYSFSNIFQNVLLGKNVEESICVQFMFRRYKFLPYHVT